MCPKSGGIRGEGATVDFNVSRGRHPLVNDALEESPSSERRGLDVRIWSGEDDKYLDITSTSSDIVMEDVGATSEGNGGSTGTLTVADAGALSSSWGSDCSGWVTVYGSGGRLTKDAVSFPDERAEAGVSSAEAFQGPSPCAMAELKRAFVPSSVA